MIKKNDFVEVEFTGKISDTGEVFDTNVESIAKEAKLDVKGIKPFTLSVGHKMLPPGLDNDLEGKEVGKDYIIELKPVDAFGNRDPKRIRMIPTKMFHEQQINPERGMQLSLDGQLVRILSNSGGRTLVDFNNPLAGKKVTYNYKILKVVGDNKEKVNAMQEFLFRKKFDFDIKEKKVTFKVGKDFEPVVKMFSPKFEEILGMKVDAKVVEIKEVEKKKDSSSNDHERHDHGHDHNHTHSH